MNRIILAEIRAIREALGGSQWDVEKSNWNVDGDRNTSILPWAVMSRVDTAVESILQMSMLSKLKENSFKSRGIQMKEYLRSLGRTKFIAFMIATCTNVGLIIGYALNVQDIQTQVTAWAPVFLAVSQLLAGVVYQWVEGSKDKAVAVGAAQIEVAKAKANTEVSDAPTYTDSGNAE